MVSAIEMFVEDRERARTTHDKLRDIRANGVLTSGSRYTGRIGVADVTDILSVERGCRIGDDDISTVYAAKVRGIEIALEVIKES